MPTPRHVLYLSPSSRLLGARRSLLQLAQNLDPERYRPLVVTKPGGDLVDALEQAGVPVRPVFLGSWRKGKHFFLRPIRLLQLWKIARKEKIDLIHCNEFHTTPYGAGLANGLGGVPLVTHNRLTITPRQIRNYHMHRAQKIVCVSRAAKQDFQDFPELQSRIEVVYNGVDVENLKSRETREETRTRLGLTQEDFIVGQFGLLSERKQPHLLIEAIRALHAGHPRLHLLLVGSPGRSDHDYAESLYRQVRQEGLEKQVRFIPFTPDVAPLYQACDLNTLVSNEEGFGRTIIEAAALGIPSIGARSGGIPELIEDGQTGLVVAPDSIHGGLKDALARLETQRDVCRRMGQAARDRAIRHFSIDAHVQAMMAVYDSLFNARKPAPHS